MLGHVDMEMFQGSAAYRFGKPKPAREGRSLGQPTNGITGGAAAYAGTSVKILFPALFSHSRLLSETPSTTFSCMRHDMTKTLIACESTCALGCHTFRPRANRVSQAVELRLFFLWRILLNLSSLPPPLPLELYYILSV